MSSSAFRDDVHHIYQAHHHWLRGILRRKLGNASDAADLAHDTFERLLRAELAAPLLEPRAYLRTIADRLIVGRARRSAIESAYLETLAALPQPVTPSPEHRLEILETLTQIMGLLDGLTQTSRRIFLLVQLDGHSYEDIGAMLGMTANAVQKSFARALVRCYSAIYDV